jgi:hypothetical protein
MNDPWPDHDLEPMAWLAYTRDKAELAGDHSFAATLDKLIGRFNRKHGTLCAGDHEYDQCPNLADINRPRRRQRGNRKPGARKARDRVAPWWQQNTPRQERREAL